MKPDKLFEVLGDINEEDVKASEEYTSREKNTVKYILPALAVAAIIILAVLGSQILRNRNPVNVPGNEVSENAGEGDAATPAPEIDIEPSPDPIPTSVPDIEISPMPESLEIPDSWEMFQDAGLRGIKTVYPRSYADGMTAYEFYTSDAASEWSNEYYENVSHSRPCTLEMQDYCTTVMNSILRSDTENTVCSPVNTYIAFAMVAEITDGETRQQILDLLGVPDIEGLRDSVDAIWKSNYIDNPDLKSLLANSIWLNDSEKYNEDTLKLLAGYYHVSSYYGDPDNPAMADALHDWINENTGDLLKDSVESIELTPNLIFEIVSCINYKAMWYDEFDDSLNTIETFHGVNGDTSVTMMHSIPMSNVCITEKFTAIDLMTTNSGPMYIYLPNEGYDVNDLLSDPDVLKFTNWGEDYDWSDEHVYFPIVHLSLPKFRVSGQTDLIEMLRSNGVTDVLYADTSNFSPLALSRNDIYLQAATHSAVVEIDEQGITGAAFTDLPFGMGGPDPDEIIDFVVDRPFVFVVTGADGSVLFSGAVRNID